MPSEEIPFSLQPSHWTEIKQMCSNKKICAYLLVFSLPLLPTHMTCTNTGKSKKYSSEVSLCYILPVPAVIPFLQIMGFFCCIVRSQLQKSQALNSDILTDLKKTTPKKQATKSETNTYKFNQR